MELGSKNNDKEETIDELIKKLNQKGTKVKIVKEEDDEQS